jgi:site-specific DNA-methyltransferase (adenine-specific)/modification methylase
MTRVETIGNATLYLADCAEVLASLKPVDLLLSDPPYGIGESGKRNASRGGPDKRGKYVPPTDYGDYQWDVAPTADLIGALLRSAGRSILWGGNFYGLPAASKWLVWDKQNGTNDFADCELAWTNLPGAVRIFRHLWNGMARASELNAPRVHPTQKPILLMDWCLQQAGDGVTTVLDPYMGSGTAGIACVNMGKTFTGIEIDPRYFDIACTRIEAAYAQGRLFA